MYNSLGRVEKEPIWFIVFSRLDAILVVANGAILDLLDERRQGNVHVLSTTAAMVPHNQDLVVSGLDVGKVGWQVWRTQVFTEVQFRRVGVDESRLHLVRQRLLVCKFEKDLSPRYQTRVS